MGLINTAATLLYYYFTKKVNYFTSTAFDKIRKSYRSHQGFACFLRLSRKMRNALYYLTVYRDNMANIPFHSILSGKIILMCFFDKVKQCLRRRKFDIFFLTAGRFAALDMLTQLFFQNFLIKTMFPKTSRKFFIMRTVYYKPYLNIRQIISGTRND